MSSIYNRIGSLIGCIHPRVIDAQDGPPPSPGTPDALDVRAPPSPPVAERAPLPRPPSPPPRNPRAGANLASGLRYGVEVEHQGLSEAQVAKAVRTHVKGALCNHEMTLLDAPDGRTWNLDEDAGGVELVTPILQGRRDLELVQRIVKTLKKAGGQTDERTGLHVHIDAARFSPEKMQALVFLMARNEHWLYPVWGVHARRRSLWCRQMDLDLVRALAADQSSSVNERLQGLTGGSRYYGLNLQNFLTSGGKNTVEFRYLNGTLDPVAIGCAVGFYMAVAERALASSDEDAPADVTPSTLPELLGELDLDPGHPVAAHLYGLLRERIKEGWRVAQHGPMPNLNALLKDDAFVRNLCLGLGAEYSPTEVAGTVSLQLRGPLALQDRLQESVDTFAASVSAFMHTSPGVGVAARLVGLYGANAQAMEPYLKLLGHLAIPSEMVDPTLDVIARNLHRGAHLANACKVAMMVEGGSPYGQRLRKLKDLLLLKDLELCALYAALMSLPSCVIAVIGHRLTEMHQHGEDILDVTNRLLQRLDTLIKNPNLALNEVLLDLMCEAALN